MELHVPLSKWLSCVPWSSIISQPALMSATSGTAGRGRKNHRSTTGAPVRSKPEELLRTVVCICLSEWLWRVSYSLLISQPALMSATLNRTPTGSLMFHLFNRVLMHLLPMLEAMTWNAQLIGWLLLRWWLMESFVFLCLSLFVWLFGFELVGVTVVAVSDGAAAGWWLDAARLFEPVRAARLRRPLPRPQDSGVQLRRVLRRRRTGDHRIGPGKLFTCFLFFVFFVVVDWFTSGRRSTGKTDGDVALCCFQLEKFYTLCQDELWGVRKACAEVFMSISRVVSQSKRRQDLGVLFVNLLQDESRWVRMAAFQALGPFISTFSRSHDGQPEEETVPVVDEVSMDSSAVVDFDADFNSFSFWRDPLPELDLVSLQLPAAAPHTQPSR